MAVELSQKIPIFKRKNKWDVVTWSQPIVGSDGIYVGEDFDRKQIMKLRRAELDPEWRVKSGEYRPQLAIDGDLLVGAIDRQARLDGRSGERLWEIREPRGERLDGLLHPWRGRLVVRRGGDFEFINLANGVVVDRYHDPHPELTIYGQGHNCVLLTRGVLARERHLVGPTVCFDLEARRAIWTQPLLDQIRERYGIDADNAIMLFLAGSLPDRVIVQRGNGTVACSIKDGRLLWGVPLPLAPHLAEGRLYGLVGDRFVALDEETGAIVYDVRHPELADSGYSFQPAAFRGQLAYAMQSGHLAVFDLKDGRLTGFHKHKEPLGGVAEADGRLLATAGDGSLLVFEETSGS